MGPSGAVDVTLPLGRSIADLVDEMLARLLPGAPVDGPGPWHLHRLGHEPLEPGELLAGAGLVDGEVLHLTLGQPIEPAHPVDDALAVLAAGAGTAPTWTASRGVAALAASVLAAATAAALALLAITPGNPVPLAVVGVLLLGGAGAQRRRSAGLGSRAGADQGAAPAPVVVDVLALASLPAWTGAGVALAIGSGAGVAADLVGAGVGALVGAAGAGVAHPQRVPWWVFTGLSGALGAACASVVLLGWLAPVRGAALSATVLVAVLGVLPHVIARFAFGSSDAPGGRRRAELLRRGRHTRALTSAACAAAAAVSAGATLVLELSRAPLPITLGLIIGALTLMRARRGRFVAESAALLLAGVVPFVTAGVEVALRGSWGAHVLLVIAVVVVLLLAVLVLGALDLTRRTDAPSPVLQRLRAPAMLRALDVLDVLASVAIVPVLVAILGLYAAAADQGSHL